VWRFRAAPSETLCAAYGQLESVWPVHGSVLVQDGMVYTVAGRSMFLDGGLRMLLLDAETGKKVSENVMDNRHPKTGKSLQHELKWPNLPTTLPDVLSYDDGKIYMRAQEFDLSGKRTDMEVSLAYGRQAGESRHLFCPTGFLDDTWWHRSYWLYGETFLGGAAGWWMSGHFAPAGRPLAMDDSYVYGFGRKRRNFRGTTVIDYKLFASRRRPEIVGAEGKVDREVPKSFHYGIPPHRRRRGINASRPKYRWTQRDLPFHARAVALTGDTFFAAGPPDFADEGKIFRNPIDAKARQKLEKQAAALKGRGGMVLWAVSASDGKRLSELRLDSSPVFDGMCAVRGRLLICRKDGTVVCLGKK
jgi:hypothetical protein